MKYNLTYKFAEKCLYDYKKNVFALNLLKQDLIIAKRSLDVKAQSYEKQNTHSTVPLDPVHLRVINIERLEKRITELERIVKPIAKLKKDLSKNPELLDILTFFYLGEADKSEILKKLFVSRAAFYRRKKKLVFLTADYLAFFDNVHKG